MILENDDFGEVFQKTHDKGSLLLVVENLLKLQKRRALDGLGPGPAGLLGLSIEGVLLYLLSMNALGFLSRGGNCDIEDTLENRELLGHYFHFLVEGKMAVFANPDKGLVGCRAGEHLYIKVHTEKVLNQLEEAAGIFVGGF